MLRIALTALCIVVGGISVVPGVVAAQDFQWRFEIVASTDTTFTFMLGEQRWVKKGMTGIIVDPRQRDELVARFSVDKIDNQTARAIITGTTTGITVFHAALIRVPKKSWLKNKLLWIGTGLGLAVGYFVGRGS